MLLNKIIALAWIFVSPETFLAKVMVLGGGSFGPWLSHKDDRISVLAEETPQSPLARSAGQWCSERSAVQPRVLANHANTLISDFAPPEWGETSFCYL